MWIYFVLRRGRHYIAVELLYFGSTKTYFTMAKESTRHYNLAKESTRHYNLAKESTRHYNLAKESTRHYNLAKESTRHYNLAKESTRHYNLAKESTRHYNLAKESTRHYNLAKESKYMSYFPFNDAYFLLLSDFINMSFAFFYQSLIGCSCGFTLFCQGKSPSQCIVGTSCHFQKMPHKIC